MRAWRWPRAESERGELVLRQRTEADGSTTLELRANGVFVMDTRETSSERALAREALARHERPHRVLVGGLGLGFTLADGPRRSHAYAAWSSPRSSPRWSVGCATARSRTARPCSPTTGSRSRWATSATSSRAAGRAAYDLVLLDVDNGPGYLVHEANAELYGSALLALVREALRPGGIVVDLVRRPRRRTCTRPARGVRRRRGGGVRRRPAGPSRAVLAAPGPGTFEVMTDFRVEHDSMGEVRVPSGRAVAGADPAGRRQLPDQRAAARARAGPRPGSHQGRRGRDQRRPRHADHRAGPRHREGRAPRSPTEPTTSTSRSTSSRPARAPAPT